MPHKINPAQILITQIAETCFDRCIQSPSTPKLDTNDSQCIIQCTSSILQTKEFILSRLMPTQGEWEEGEEENAESEGNEELEESRRKGQ